MSLFGSSQYGPRERKNKFLLYKVGKIIVLVKKIKRLVTEEGLDEQCAMKSIYKSFRMTEGCIPLDQLNPQFLEMYLTERLVEDGNRFAVSLWQNLDQAHKGLLQKLHFQESHSDNSSLVLLQQRFLKLQQNFPSFKQNSPKQIKQQQQVLQQKENTFNKQRSSKQKHACILQKIDKKKKDLEKYLEQKLAKINGQDGSLLREEEQCNKKYGPKVQMQRHNYEELEEVRKLRVRLLGYERSRKIKNQQANQINLERRLRSSSDKAIGFEPNSSVRQVSN